MCWLGSAAVTTSEDSTTERPAAIARRRCRVVESTARGMWSGGYDRAFASLYRRSTSPGMRPRAGTEIPLSVAHDRISLGSRVAFAERGDAVVFGRRRLDRPFAETGRLTFQYVSKALDSEARFFFDRSSSRQSPFHPIRTVSTPSDPSRSSINTSTVAFAISFPFQTTRRYPDALQSSRQPGTACLRPPRSPRPRTEPRSADATAPRAYDGSPLRPRRPTKQRSNDADSPVTDAPDRHVARVGDAPLRARYLPRKNRLG
jgi:hypothetical protein